MLLVLYNNWFSSLIWKSMNRDVCVMAALQTHDTSVVHLFDTSIIIPSCRYVYVIWMWIDWYRKYQPAEQEYEVWWRVSETNESQTSYSVEQADIFQYQPYSHSDDMFIILKSNINTDTSIFVFSREKSHDSKYSKYASPKHSS